MTGSRFVMQHLQLQYHLGEISRSVFSIGFWTFIEIQLTSPARRNTTTCVWR
jgi:hypothetical protein